MIELQFFDWLLAGFAAFCLGISKAGIKGLGIFFVTIFAIVFGSKSSSGIVLPMLCVGDLFAIIYYRRDVNWSLFFSIFPYMIVGVILGAILGKDLPESLFKYGMASIIIVSVTIMIWWDQRKSEKIPGSWVFGSFLGVLGGVTTMVGNLAGAFVNLFFLALRVPKAEFIGTAAWLFFFVNLFKLPFHIYSWETITPSTLRINLYLLPAIALGLFLGVRLVKIIEESMYRKLILFLTALGAIIIMLK
ncbi:MAG: sulfite exporter TauE/SafE family protein [Bacteroidia bacterium]|nr:sulfite exporter TauE/SafE family protein [Bacteroidia bacterium]